MLDLVDNLLVTILLPIDRSLSLWITRRCKTYRMQAKPIQQHVEPFAQAIFATLQLENTELFSLGLSNIQQRWRRQFPLPIYGLASATASGTNGTFAWYPRTLNCVMRISTEMFNFQVPNDTTIIRLLEEYRPEWRVNQYNCLDSAPLVPGTPQPFLLRLTCHKVRQGVILP